MIKVTSKKWVENKKTGLHGFRNQRVTRLICIAKNGVLKSPRNSTPTRIKATQKNVVGQIIKNFEILKTESESGLSEQLDG